MASNKKINIPISSLSSDEIYALLDSTESGEVEEIEKLMDDFDTEFVNRSVVENKDSDMHVDEEPETTSNDAHSNFIPTHPPIQAVVRQDVPEEESSDDEGWLAHLVCRFACNTRMMVDASSSPPVSHVI